MKIQIDFLKVFSKKETSDVSDNFERIVYDLGVGSSVSFDDQSITEEDFYKIEDYDCLEEEKSELEIEVSNLEDKVSNLEDGIEALKDQISELENNKG